MGRLGVETALILWKFHRWSTTKNTALILPRSWGVSINSHPSVLHLFSINSLPVPLFYLFLFYLFSCSSVLHLSPNDLPTLPQHTHFLPR